MKIIIGLALCSTILLAGCQSTTQAITSKENLLSAAGFTARPAATDSQIAAIKSLPANKLIQQNSNGQIIYIYSDPTVCQCIYVGNPSAYSKYKQMIFQKNLANEEQITASMENDPFDFSPWGGFWGY